MNEKQREEYPPFCLDLAEDWMEEQCYVDGNEAWYVKNLWDLAKDLPTYEVPLIGLTTDHAPWDSVGDNFMAFCAHVRLVNKANLDYPIILTPKGIIADGRHRLAKAIVEGHSTIKVTRLVFMPVPDFEYDEEGNTMVDSENRPVTRKK